MRPLANAVIKGGITLYDRGAEMVAEAGEQLSDLVAEVRSELNATAAAAAASPLHTARACRGAACIYAQAWGKK